MKLEKPLLLCASLAVLAPAAAVAHIRLISATNGVQLSWNSPSNISIVVNSTGSDDVADATENVAIQMAIDEWNGISGSDVQLVENTSPTQQSRTDWTATNIHLVMFDETNTSGFFPGGSGTVAITPLLYNSISGKILDADVLFNGNGFNFTTTSQAGRFDVQDVATHELGHLLGLDHTGAAGGTMFPYVDPTVILHRSLSEDDRHGMRDAYPTSTLGTLTGTVRRASDSSNVRGAFVVARDTDGRNITAALTNSAGVFSLKGLDPGSYTVYARPLDSPVSSSNLGPGFVIETDFEPTVYGSAGTITATETVDMGVLSVGADVSLTLGTNADIFPIFVEAGTSKMITVRGAGLVTGSTLSISDSDMTLGTPTWGTGMVLVQVTVPGGEAPGHVDLTVTNSGGDVSILPAAIEVVPPTPAVTGVSPATGSTAGGTPVTITGTNFRAGARVVIGDRMYSDGQGSTTVLNATTIQLVTDATTAGIHDVVVFDASGVEGRLGSGFQAAAIPSITSVFPPAGSATGGTTVTLMGQNFLPGATVRIDGVTQTGVTISGTTQISFTTTSGTVGGPFLLEVENTDSGLASSLFSYTAQPDPMATGLSPAIGALVGGDVVTITGSGFTATTTVTFGVDPSTGTGGTPAAAVNFVNVNTLEATTPGFATAGAKAVLLSEPGTGQATTSTTSFTVLAPSGGSSGGGCYTTPFTGPPGGPREILMGAWWILALGLWLALQGRGMRSKRADMRA